MQKIISIDPGKCKCGIVIVDWDQRLVLNAIIINSDLLAKNIKAQYKKNEEIKVIIGNGTTSEMHSNNLKFLGKHLITVEEKNTTFRARERYFQLFPLKGVKKLLPKEIFIMNINLDAISALIILEDFLSFKFEKFNSINPKTWTKS